MTQLYCFTDELNWRAGQFKIGDTTTQTVEERVAQQQGSANSSPLKILGSWDIGNNRDHAIHQILAKDKDINWLPKEVTGGAREWFKFTNKDEHSVLVKVNCAVNQLLHDIPRPNSYSPRNEQKYCIQKAVNATEKFLIAADTRFGKSFVSYNICKCRAAKNVLILSFKTQANDSWKNELENHIMFINSKYFDYNEHKVGKPILDAIEMNVVFVSFQSIAHKSGKFDWIYDMFWDVIIIDEEHYGIDTTKTQKILEKLRQRCQFFLHVSATPIRSLLFGKFAPENTFKWSYCDTQEKKREEQAKNLGLFEYEQSHQYTFSAPRMVFLGYEFSLDVKKELVKIAESYSIDENPCFRKMLTVDENGYFRFPSAVNAILNQLSGWQYTATNIFSDNAEKACGKSVLNSKMLEHTLWAVPGIKEGEALAVALQKHPHFKSYEVILAVGDNETSIAKTKNAIKLAKSNEKRTITISCGRFFEAVTVPEWGTIVLLSDMKSLQTYFQVIGRIKSQWEKFKSDDVYVIDFSLRRMLTGCYVAAKEDRRQGESSSDAIIRRLRNAPMYRSNNELIELIEVNASYVTDVASKIDVKSLFNGESVIQTLEWSDDQKQALKNIDVTKRKVISKSIELLISDTGVKPGKALQREKKEKIDAGEDESDIELLESFVLAAQIVEQRLPSYLLVSNKNEKCIDEILSLQDVATHDYFERHVGIPFSAFELLLKVGRFDVDDLDDKLDAFSRLKQNVSEAETFEEVIKLASALAATIYAEKTEVLTPSQLIQKQLDKLPSYVWSSTDYTFLDPHCGRGSYLFEVCIRLWKHSSITDEKNRAKNVISRVYGADISRVQYERLVFLFDLIFERWALTQNDFKLYNVNSLEHNFGMKFDVVMGNPPYVNGLHLKFVRKALECINDEGKAIILHPCVKWVKQGRAVSTNDRELMQFLNEVELINPYAYFNVEQAALAAMLSIAVLSKKKNDGNVVLSIDDVTRRVNIDDVSYHTFQPGFLQFRDRILAHKGPRLIHISIEGADISDKSGWCIATPLHRGHIEKKSELVVDFFAPDFFTWLGKDAKVEQLVIAKLEHRRYYIVSHDEARIQRILKFLHTKFARACLMLYKLGTNMGAYALKEIPDVDSLCDITSDLALYKHFNLTQIEIDMIERLP